MKLISDSDLTYLADLACDAAAEAADLIARSRPRQVEHKAAGESLASQVVTEVDRQSEALIVAALEPTLDRHELALLTEERVDDGGRHSADHFWCIDPLDGTLPFIEGTPGYAVSIALVRRDGTPLIGVVHDPVDGTVLHAVRGRGAFHNGTPWQPPSEPGTELALFADRSFAAWDGSSRVVAGLERIATDIGCSGLRVDATAGGVMNACQVLLHPPACYVKWPRPTGGGSVWDFAATACLFGEAGAIATDINGDRLDLNRTGGTRMGHRGVLFATDAALARRIRSIDVGGEE